MKPLFAFVTSLFLLLAAPYAMAADIAPAAATLDHTLGKADAPITVNEYISLTCPHCAEFYNDTLPALEKAYVDSGKVKFVLHGFALNGVDLKAFTIANCMPADEFFPFVSVLYKNQASWVTAKNPETVIAQYAQLGGLGGDQVKACLADTKMQDAIATEVKQAQDKLGIQSTPTFIIEPGSNRIEGARSAQEFGSIFDRMLAEKK